MRVSEFQKVSKILGRITNNASITNLYRSAEVGIETIRACSEYGNIEFWVEPTGLTNPVLINTAAFIGVSSSLPADAEIAILNKDNQIQWKCGDAKGHWTGQPTDRGIPQISHETFDWAPPKEFGKALQLAASACQAQTVAIGLYGVMLDASGENIRLMSSNSTSFAMASIPKGDYPGGSVTLRPPIPAIIAAILGAEPEARMDVTSEGIFILAPSLVAHLPLAAPLEHDISKIISKFSDNQYPITVDSGAIRKFLNRAKALADKGFPVAVSFRVAEGRLLLEHHSVSASAEEYFLSDGIDPSWTFSSVELPVDLLLIAMEHVTAASLDYLGQNILVLRGENPTFAHIIGGVVKKAKG